MKRKVGCSVKNQTNAYKEFIKDFKSNKTGNILLLFGKEQFLCKWAIEQIEKKYTREETRFMDVQILDGWEFDASKTIAAAEALPIMSDKRVVIVKNFKALEGNNRKYLKSQDLKSMEQYLKKVSESTILIFTNEKVDFNSSMGKLMKKYVKCYEFRSLSKQELRSFARKRFKFANIDISSSNMEFLLDSTGYFNKENDYNLFQFENDLSKLIAVSNGVEITEKNIEDAVCRAEDLFVYNLLDNIMSGRKDQAFIMLKGIIEGGDNIFPLISLMASQYEILLAIKELQQEGMNQYAIAETIKVNKYRVGKLVPHARKKNINEIKRNLSLVYEIPRSIKTGLLPADLALQLFIAQA